MSGQSGRVRLGLGIFHQAWAYAESGDAAVLGGVVRTTELAEELGCFDVAWFTEQHDHLLGGFWGRVAAPHLLMAHLAAGTDRIGLGAAVRLVAGLDPRRVAEEAVTLEHLAGRGRIHLGLGTGMSRSTDADAREHRRSLVRQHAAQLDRCLRGESAQVADELAVSMGVPDLADRVYVATTDQRTLAQAADLGQGYLLGMFGGDRHPAMARTFRDLGGRGPVRAVRLVHVAASDAQAVERIEQIAHRLWSSFTPPSDGWRATKELLGTRPPLQVVLDQLGWIVGGPQTVADEITRYARACELDGIDLAFHVPGLPETVVRHAMRLFASDVVPRVREASESDRALADPHFERIPTATGVQP